MKLFNKTMKQILKDKSQKFNIQSSPVLIGNSDAPAYVKVDIAYNLGSLVLVAGWITSKDAKITILDHSGTLDTNQLRLVRPDVAQHFGLAGNEMFGFVLLTHHSGSSKLSLVWELINGLNGISEPLHLETKSEIGPEDQVTLGSTLISLAFSLQPHTQEWSDLINKLPTASEACNYATGWLEGASHSKKNNSLVVFGWTDEVSNAKFWLEDNHGKTYSLESALRYSRQDLIDLNKTNSTGFITHIVAFSTPTKIKLRCLSESGVHTIHEISCNEIYDEPVAAARWLFGIHTPISLQTLRFSNIDDPILNPLIKYRNEIWKQTPTQLEMLGTQVQQPIVSIIVPLYGRTDFVEHQLIEFSQDAWLLEHAEIIYVLDDPKLLESFITQAETLQQLYQVPFKWVWGGSNRGFSGANNLGVQNALGEYLLFLNSDAFPQKSGWILPLLDVLIKNPNIGAVGPRLVFADGSIQHAGMEFIRSKSRGVWLNHHPKMGLDPILDPKKELTLVQAVTGACLAMRRSDFDEINGWDTEYLIGDFEDSDLCLKLRSKGMNIAYLPTVQLTHLERQSFKTLGSDDFRTKVVYYNAIRQQARWGNLLSQPVDNSCLAKE
jgi:GT2 family glycosyltransferase